MTAQNKLSQWKGAGQHDVTLPSGTKVKILIPNLPKLIEAGQIPNNLIDAAIGAASGRDRVTREVLTQQAEFTRHIVSIAVIEPKLEPTDVDELPFEDVEMLVEIATRQRDIDAVGHHISGLEKVDEWRRFRGLDHLV